MCGDDAGHEALDELRARADVVDPFVPVVDRFAHVVLVGAVAGLAESWLWLDPYRTVEELNQAHRNFVHRFNNYWIIGRIGYRTPAAHRRFLLGEAA